MIEIKDHLGKDFIGQPKLRNEVNFSIEAFKNTGFFPSSILISRRGDGKTMLARMIGKEINRKMIEINGANLEKKTAPDFINKIIIPNMDEPLTLFIDEVHNVSRSILELFLSILAPSKNNVNEITHDESVITIDLNKMVFLFATTNPEKMSKALMNRVTNFTLEPYSTQNLIDILHKNSEIEFINNVEERIVSVCRSSPRTLIKIYNEKIKHYCDIKRQNIFSNTDWDILRSYLGILPLGLENQELELLKLLNDRGPMTLTAIASSMALDVKTVRQHVESFLLMNALIKIDGKRNITHKGKRIIEEIY